MCEGCCFADELSEVIERPVVHRAHGNYLLTQDIQRQAGKPHWLKKALGHAIGEADGQQQVVCMRADHVSTADFTDAVSRTSHPLQSARHRRR